ncbi:hypothetical protein [Aquitalea pelogenes]|uniref:hypothetical protein n=1 Tax=Aquitalea pelogenes TaxID=1293573 RepID=UPI0035B3E337
MMMDDLLQWRALLQQPVAFHAFLLQGLLQGGWSRQPHELTAAAAREARQLLRLWLHQAPIANETDALTLMQARGALRRVQEGLDDSLEQLLLDALGNEGQLDPLALGDADRLKLALLGDARLLTRFSLQDWSSKDPIAAMLFAIQSLDAHLLDSLSQLALQRLAECIPAMGLADLPLALLNPLMLACHRLSYIDSPRRYDAKQKLVDQAAAILFRHGKLPGPVPPPPARNRPRLLVIGEGLREGHALFRFFAEPLRDMRQHFDVVLLCDASVSDATLAELGDSAIRFAVGPDPLTLWTEQITALAPDVIFYPGIGMSFPTFTLSLMRLAPLQVASIGCPAASCSAQIDATLLFDTLTAPPGLPQPIRYNKHRLRPARAGMAMPQRQRPADGAPIRIAVNAMAIKLNDGFLAALERVMTASAPDTELLFMPNADALETATLARQLSTRLPASRVIPSQDHTAYMAALAECDLVLQSFPFGGANTTRDALDLGIPVVALDSPWLSGQTDSLLLADRGLGHLCSSHVDDYVALAISLARPDSPQRKDIRQQLAAMAHERQVSRQGELDAGTALFRYWQNRQGAAR